MLFHSIISGMLLSPSGNPVWKVQKVCVAISAQPFQLYDFTSNNQISTENIKDNVTS